MQEGETNPRRRGVETLGNKISCRFLVQFSVRWEKGWPTIGHIHFLRQSVEDTAGQSLSLRATGHVAQQSVSLKRPRAADSRATGRDDPPPGRTRHGTCSISLQIWNFFTINILRKKQKNLVASHINFLGLSAAEIWDRAFPSLQPHAHFSEMLVKSLTGQPHSAWEPEVG